MTVPTQRKVFYFLVGIIITIVVIGIINISILSISNNFEPAEQGFLSAVLLVIGVFVSGMVSFSEMTGFKPGDPVLITKNYYDYFSDSKEYKGIYVGKADLFYYSIKIEDGRVMNFRKENVMFDITKNK